MWGVTAEDSGAEQKAEQNTRDKLQPCQTMPCAVVPKLTDESEQGCASSEYLGVSKNRRPPKKVPLIFGNSHLSFNALGFGTEACNSGLADSQIRG